MDSDPDDPSPTEPVQDYEPDEPPHAAPDPDRTDSTEPDEPPPADTDPEPTPASETEEGPAVELDSAVPDRLNSLSLQEPSSDHSSQSQRHVSNGSLPADFYASASDEIEIVEEDEGLASSSGGGGAATWTNRGDGPPSPSSSGYAAERGSSGTSSGEIEEDTGDSEWGREKKHLHEDDASDSWRKRKKHFFILSNSGKPIYSRYGDEHKLAGFSATLQAIISFVENSGDSIKFVRAGKHQIVFLVKGPIYLVCISCTDEPVESLRGQLELLYGQVLLILTKSVNRCFEKNPKFDMAPLLGGTDSVFSSLIHSFSWNPATFLHAYTCLPLSYPTRQAASAILQDVAESGMLFAILMCKHKVVSLVGAQKATLHPDDILLLANFILSSESFRTSESFSPICLPRFNPMAFLYAYVHFLDLDTYLVLLTTRSDSFYHLKDCRVRVQNVLAKSNVLSEVQRSMMESGLRIEDLPSDAPRIAIERPNTEPSSLQRSIGGPAGLCHFIYKSVYLNAINNFNSVSKIYFIYF